MEIKEEFSNFVENVIKFEMNLVSKEATRPHNTLAELETSLSCIETHIRLIRLAVEKLDHLNKSK